MQGQEASVEQLRAALDRFGALTAGIAADQWHDPTPCSEWDVRALVQHLVAGNQLFASALRGDQPGHGAHSDPTSDLMSELAVSSSELLDAFAAPGTLERPVQVPFGTVPGAVALHLRITEALVHGWDLAHATGRQPGFDETLANQELEFSRAALAAVPAERRPFGPAQPVEDQAPALDRLAALLGRVPG